MGGGAGRIDFGKTIGSKLDAATNDAIAKSSVNFLDALSNGLTAVSLVPGFDTITNFLSIPVDLARGDYLSAGLDVLGIVPFYGEIADAAKIANKADKTADAAKVAKKASKGKKITNPIVTSKRIGKATKTDAYHNFPNVIDNYAGKAKTFPLKGADGKTRELFQIGGSYKGKKGIFEWILDNEKGVTHRRFIENGKITGKPNWR
jgi:hypothetical protein